MQVDIAIIEWPMSFKSFFSLSLSFSWSLDDLYVEILIIHRQLRSFGWSSSNIKCSNWTLYSRMLSRINHRQDMVWWSFRSYIDRMNDLQLWLKALFLVFVVEIVLEDEIDLSHSIFIYLIINL